MEIKRRTLDIRGQRVDVAVPGADASDPEVIASTLECVLLCLIALEDPRVDAILSAYGVPTSDPESFFLPPDVDNPEAGS